MFGDARWGGYFELLHPGIFPPNESPATKRDWTNQPINQLQSVVWEGLKQPTRPIITSVDETTAEQLAHTKRKVPLFVFGQGLSSKAATGGRQMFGFTLG